MITQRLILDGPYPDGVWTCIGCASPLTEGRIQHPDDCPELRRGNDPGPLPPVAQVSAWLLAHGWTPGIETDAGRAWVPPVGGGWIAIPRSEGDWSFPGALERIASRSGLPFGEVLAGMRATEAGEGTHG